MERASVAVVGLAAGWDNEKTTFENVDDLLNPRRIDDFDRLKQESVWLHFGPNFRLVVCFGLSRELYDEFLKFHPTYSVEEEDSNRVRRADDDFSLLNLHSSIEGYQQVRGLHIFVHGIIARFLHGLRTIDAEQYHVAFTLEPLHHKWINVQDNRAMCEPTEASCNSS